MKVTRRLVLAVAAIPLLAGCATTAEVYVSPDDSALTACQAADVQNISALQASIDNANATNPDANMNGSGPSRLSPAQTSSLKQAVVVFRHYADQVHDHAAFSFALRNEAQEFSVAASSPTGLTTNTVAVATDRFSAEIQGDCASFQVGSAPQSAKPGPGIWDWGLFGIVLGGYVVMTLIGGYIIAVGQRSRPREKRLSPAQIFWLSLIWWVTIFAALGRVWGDVISTATLSPDERRDDRIAAQQKEIARLEKAQQKENARLRKLQD